MIYWFHGDNHVTFNGVLFTDKNTKEYMAPVKKGHSLTTLFKNNVHLSDLE